MENLSFILSLSAREKKLLEERNVSSVQKFLHSDNRRLLEEIFGADADDISEKVRLIFGLEVVRGADLMSEKLLKVEKFSSGIEAFDRLFKDNLMMFGEIIEVTGPASSGKTVTMYTLMINILDRHDVLEILFIDTKNDFQPREIKRMMDRRRIEEARQVKILKRIEVEQVVTPEDLIKTLSFILHTPLQRQSLKIIIIDSITIPFYLYIGHTLFSLKLMTEVVDLVKTLAKGNITFFITNLANYRDSWWVDNNLNKTSQESAGTASSKTEKAVKVRLKPALGVFWESTADHKVLIDFIDYPHQFDKNVEKIHRQISLLTSRTSPAPSEPNLIEITDKGVF